MKKHLHTLTLLVAICLVPLLSRGTTLFSENFSSQALPAGWTNDSLGQPAVAVWLFDNPYARAITGAGFDANFAIFDSDMGNSNDNFNENASLTTPDINISTANTTLFLEMDEQYRALGGPSSLGSSRRIEYSIDNGTSWTTLIYDSVDLGYPTAIHSSYNISSILGSSSTVRFRFTWTGSWDWWWAIDNLSVTSFPICAATPNAGEAVASSATVCQNSTVNLSLSGADVSPLFTYQWYSSPDSTNWTAEGTASTFTATVFSETYYYCVVTCGSFSSNSVAVYVGLNPPYLCPCPGDHGGTDCTADHITNVSITGTTLDNSSACDNLNGVAYSFFPVSPSTTGTLNSGASYDFNVTTVEDNIISIWIDFNHDGTLADTEWMQVCLNSVAGTPNTVNWTMPTGLTPGPSVMRVRSRFNGNINDGTSACTTFFSGETEDYLVGLDENVNVDNITRIGSMVLYPNPASDMITLFFGNTIEKATISIFDNMGRLATMTTADNVVSKQLSVSGLENGLYFVRISTPQGEQTKRVIITR